MKHTIATFLSASCLFVFSFFCLRSSAQTVAFPGALGFGANVTGGRAGTVYHVTSLNDAGAGSFRDAVGTAGRIVVFDVSGYITLLTAVSAKSNLTIAGQTAPGEGIGFRGGKISLGTSSNIIIRHIRIRPGSETATNNDVALNLLNARDIILDHCSLEFAPWNNVDGVSTDWQNTPVTNITFQYCLNADPTYQQFGAHCESVNSNWSWFHNIFANSHNRNPLAKTNTVFINNVLYNCSAGYTTHTSGLFKHDIINNYFIFGPASTGTDNTWYQIDANQSIYYSGNIKDNNLDGALNGAATTPYWYSGTGTILTSPWWPAPSNVTVYDVKTAYRLAASLAGTFPRDQMDSLIINQVKTLGKGSTGFAAGDVGPNGSLYTSQTQTGLGNNGYGTIQSGVKDADSDNDGMPDYWESATGSDNKVNDAMKLGSDGYAAIERYINWLADFHARTTGTIAVSIDLVKYAKGFSDVNPTFSVSNAVGGTVALSSDKHTATFMPAGGFVGLASFNFTVSGSDNTSYSGKVSVLVAPSGTGLRENPFHDKTMRAHAAWRLNPVTNVLTLDNADANEYEIADVSGRLLAKSNFNTPPGQTRNVDVSGFSNGVYLARVYSNGRFDQFRFFKRN